MMMTMNRLDDRSLARDQPPQLPPLIIEVPLRLVVLDPSRRRAR